MGKNRSYPEDDGTGCLRGAAGTSQLLKPKGLWAYVMCTISCNNPVDPSRMEVRPLVVLSTETVATHMPEEEVTKLAQNHVDHINSTQQKRKKNKGKHAMSPTPTQTQKKVRTNQQDAVEGSGLIKHGNIALGRPSTTTLDESLWNDQENLEDTRIEGNAE